MLTETVQRWIASPSTTPDQLRAKLAEYQRMSLSQWSGRDTETITRLRAALRAELTKRGEPHDLVDQHQD